MRCVVLRNAARGFVGRAQAALWPTMGADDFALPAHAADHEHAVGVRDFVQGALGGAHEAALSGWGARRPARHVRM